MQKDKGGFRAMLSQTVLSSDKMADDTRSEESDT